MIPIADRHVSYCEAVAERMRAQQFRGNIDARSERMNAKIRDAQLQKIPYMCVVGDKELEQDSVSLRLRSGKDEGKIAISDLIPRMQSVTQAMIDL